MEPKLTRNSVYCNNCKTELVSEHRHDFVVCKCWGTPKGIAADGGLDYIKRSWGKEADFEETSEYED